ncbi:MAG: methylenetetrahydrofolate reductase [archaeon]
MEKITDLLSKKFTVSVEIVPPRNGTDPNIILNDIGKLKDKVDFISVTKGAGGSLRGGTLPLTVIAKEKYNLLPIAHFVCREHTTHEIENELFDLHYFGIKNILALRGDAPAGQKSLEWEGDYKYAFMLVKQISDMNKGLYVPRANVDNGPRVGIKTDFCVLVAGHPEDPIEDEIIHMKIKADAGAGAIITQMIFDFEEYRKYVTSLRNAGITLPVIAGVRPLTSLAQAESLEKFFGLIVPQKLKKGLAGDETNFGINYTFDMVKKLKEFGASGVHFFLVNDINLFMKITEKLLD